MRSELRLALDAIKRGAEVGIVRLLEIAASTPDHFEAGIADEIASLSIHHSVDSEVSLEPRIEPANDDVRGCD